MKVGRYFLKNAALLRLVEGADVSIDIGLLESFLNREGWVIHPVLYQGKVVGAILEKDGVLHTSIAPKYQKRWNPRPYIKSILYPALDRYKVLYSDAAKNDLRAQRWLTKLGFVFLKEESDTIYYKLTEKLY